MENTLIMTITRIQETTQETIQETTQETTQETIDYNTIMPPEPPSPLVEIMVNIGSDNFNYLSCSQERKMLTNAFQAISITENWNFMKQDIESYQLSSDPKIETISKKMNELGYDGHSGFSFGWTMRQMQTIAKYGAEYYKKRRLTE